MSNPINLKMYTNFLNEESCKYIISLGEPDLIKAGVLGDEPDYRIAETKFFNPDHKALKRIREIVAKQTGLPMENQEPMSIIKYSEGGIFKAHYDCFQEHAPYYESVMKQGGQRVKTCLIYLNQDFEGGDTEFPRMNYKIRPTTGTMVIWDNIDQNGKIIPEAEHIGSTVTKGVKYLISIWIREKTFSTQPTVSAESVSN